MASPSTTSPSTGMATWSCTTTSSPICKVSIGTWISVPSVEPDPRGVLAAAQQLRDGPPGAPQGQILQVLTDVEQPQHGQCDHVLAQDEARPRWLPRPVHRCRPGRSEASVAHHAGTDTR